MNLEQTADKDAKDCIENALVPQIEALCLAANVPCDAHITEVSRDLYRLVVRCIARPPFPTDAQWVEVLRGVESKCAHCNLIPDINHYREGNDPIDGQPFAVWLMRFPATVDAA